LPQVTVDLVSTKQQSSNTCDVKKTRLTAVLILEISDQNKWLKIYFWPARLNIFPMKTLDFQAKFIG